MLIRPLHFRMREIIRAAEYKRRLREQQEREKFREVFGKVLYAKRHGSMMNGR